jgi:hypothetical protein
MKKNTLVLILSTCILMVSAIILAIGPITNKKIGVNWGYQNCGLISDQIDTSSQDSETLKQMKHLCSRQKVMYDLEYCAFIINIVAGFVCADLALLHYMEISRDFDIKTGVISCAFGFIGFVLSLVYVCYSGYIFTKDAAYVGLDISYDNFNFNTYNAIEKLYNNGARSKWDADANDYLPEYNSDRGTFAAFIKYKDLGKSLYNYDSDYYKKYEGYMETDGEIYKCRESQFNSDCKYIYSEPQTEKTNKELYDRWLTALILACVVVLCNLLLAILGLFLFANFGRFLD